MGFIASAFLVVFSLVAAVIPSIAVPGVGEGEEPLFPAPPGYLLPWAGGRLHDVTQGEETSITHNGLAAYAFDFGLNYDNVVAARSGRVSMVYDWSNQSGCDPALAIASNYVVIDHGDGTSALYLHLSYDSVIVAVGDLVSRGQVIGLSGDTGVTCGDGEDGGASAPHLHFQVQHHEEGRYFTQSMPVAFDDVNSNNGVPLEGETLVSGNYGRGKPQKIKLTAYRSQRVFSPKATPADPSLTELHETPTPEATPTETAATSETPTPGSSETPGATETPQPTSTNTPEPDDDATVEPTPPPDSPTPGPSGTPEPAPSDTPAPQPSDTPPAAQGDATEPPPNPTEPPAADSPTP